MVRSFLVILSFTVVLSNGALLARAGQDPTTHPDPLPLSVIRPDHPRIWFNSDNVDLLRNRWSDPEYAPIVNKYAGNTDPVSLALEGLATNNAAKCSEAAATVSDDYESGGGGPGVGYVNPISLVFDWCYDYLNAQERSDLRSKIEALRTLNRDHPGIGIRNRFHWHEAFWFSTFAYIASVLAIEGEPGVSPELREAQNVLQNLQELGDEVSGDGGYRTYFYQGNFQTLPFLMWSYATDFDFAAHSGFSRNLAQWTVYRLSPSRRGFVRGPADDDAVESGFTRDTLSAGGFYLLASHFDDPIAQWLGNIHRDNFGQAAHWRFSGPSFISLVHYEPNRQSAGPSESGMLVRRLFENIGMVHLRSAWGEGLDVIHSWFYNGPAAGHSGESQNHFTIWRGDDPLILQGGNYLGTPSVYQSHYYERAVSENTVVFSPAGSESPDHDGGQTKRWSNRELSKEVYPVAERVGSWSGQHLYSGEIVHFKDDGRITAVSGNATLAYDPANVNSYIRDFVYLRPDVFLIRDRFDITNVEKIRSLIHSRNGPVYVGSPTIVEGTTDAGILELQSSTFELQNGTSEAHIDVLWPGNITLRFVGGEGYEGFADGYNTDPMTDSEEWLHDHPELLERVRLIRGQWRTEIETTPSMANGNLIKAIFVARLGTSTIPEYKLDFDGTDIAVTVTHHWRATTVVFPDNDVPKVIASTPRRVLNRRRSAELPSISIIQE